MNANDCLVCAKHRDEASVPGGFLYADELVVATHVSNLERDDRLLYLGHLVIETRRHATSLADLTPDEGAAVGRAAIELARAVTEALDVERVYTATIGHHVPHFHFHLFPRYRGTPPDVAWHSADEWDGAPKGRDREIAATVDRIRARLGF